MSKHFGAKRFLLFAGVLIVAALGITANVPVRSQKDDPASKEPTGPAASRVIAAKSRVIPKVDTSRESVLAFVDFAGGAGADQREEIRKSLDGLRTNGAAISTLCEEAFRAQKEDHSRALLILSLLGETRSEDGAKCLARFLEIPFPQTGTTVDGEIIEQTALATLQAKAIDGLSYMNNPQYNQLVLDQVKSHPSIIVRAEAIDAYLWNNRNNAAAARSTLNGAVRQGEQIYLDRVRRETGESKDAFNRKLEAFLKAHPDRYPPKPEPDKDQGKPKDEQPGRTAAPPKF